MGIAIDWDPGVTPTIRSEVGIRPISPYKLVAVGGKIRRICSRAHAQYQRKLEEVQLERRGNASYRSFTRANIVPYNLILRRYGIGRHVCADLERRELVVQRKAIPFRS